MLKKIIVGALIVVLIGAVGVGIIDAAQGKSIAAQSQTAAAQPSVASQSTPSTTTQGQNFGRGGGQGQAQGRGNQGKGNGTGGQGQTQNPNPGTPQANVTDWVTVKGTVNSFDGIGVSLTTAEVRPLGAGPRQSRYVSAQASRSRQAIMSPSWLRKRSISSRNRDQRHGGQTA
jgi:hypothetical protein